MSNYFVMCSAPAIESDSARGYIDIEDWDGIEGFEDWGRGTPAQRHPSGPVVIQAVPHDGCAGAPDDFQDMSVPLMSRPLKEAIDAAGVDNVRFFPVALRNTETAEVYEYFAFNLVGLGAAAGSAREGMSSHDGDFLGDTHVRRLRIDDASARGLLMFRLQEKFSVILVHESVKESVERSKISTVKFVKPEDFVAL